ncbi:MAG: transposase, partial [Caldimonas sp.]
PKHERRFTGFDDKIIAMYARGMTMREVQGFLADQYGVEVSPEFISSVTDAVMAEVGAWQARPLEPMYPVVFFDAPRVKIRETPAAASHCHAAASPAHRTRPPTGPAPKPLTRFGSPAHSV